jgi:hypothetical protein
MVVVMPNTDLTPQIRAAIAAHGGWKLKLKTAINTGQINVSPDEVACHTCCEFGQWLEGSQIHPLVKERKPYQVIHRLHREFHQSAGEVMRLVAVGDKRGAVSVLTGEYAEKTEKLSRGLIKWMREQPKRATAETGYPR